MNIRTKHLASVLQEPWRLLPHPLPPRPLLWSLLATVFILVPIVLSSQTWAQTSWLPHPHDAWFDRAYFFLDPLAVYLLTGFLTFFVLCWPRHWGWLNVSSNGLSAALGLVGAQALVLFAAATLLSFGIEHALKSGLSRARPVTQLEHSLIAAHVENGLPDGLLERVQSNLFECPVGHFVFSAEYRRFGEPLEQQLVDAGIMGRDEAVRHVRTIIWRTGLAPFEVDISRRVDGLISTGPWRKQNLVPFLAGALPSSIGGHDIDDTKGSAPSGHVLRQSLVLFLFFMLAYDRAGLSIRRWSRRWKLFLALQVAALAICFWSRLYGFDHSWSDELLSFALTIGVLSFAYVIQRTVISSQRGILKLVFDNEATNLMSSMKLIVVAFDRDGHVLLWNQEAERVTGYSANEVRSLDDYVRKMYKYADPDVVLKKITRMMTDTGYEQPSNIVASILARDGRRKLIVWSGVLISDGYGTASGKLSIGFEISGVERRLADLGASTWSLLREIIANLDSLRASIQREGSDVQAGLTRLVSVCEQYRRQIVGSQEPRPVAAHSIVEGAVLSVTSEARDCSVRLRQQVESNLPQLLCHEWLLRPALSDLLRQAVRSSASAARTGEVREVWLRVRSKDGSTAKYLEFEIEDDGPQKPPTLEQAFTPGPIYEYAGEPKSEECLTIMLAGIAAREHAGWLGHRVEGKRNMTRLVIPVLPLEDGTFVKQEDLFASASRI